MILKKLLYYILFGFFVIPSYTQVENYRFMNFGFKDGLQDKFIYAATQDQKGYMWFGTGTGLYRYDGHVFKYFRSPLDKSGSAISNILQGLMTDADGNIWAGSFTTLQWYNPVTNVFWQPNLQMPEIKKMAASFIVNFSKGKYLWLSTNKNYIYRFQKKDSSFMSFAKAYPAGASASSIQTVEVGNYVYDIHPEGIYIFSLDGKWINTIAHIANDLSNALYDAKERAIYLTTYMSGLLKFDITTNRIVDLAPDNKDLKANNLLSIEKDDEDNFYLGGYPLHLLNPTKKTYLNFFSDKIKNEFSIGASKVVSIFKDREKNLWICSHSGLSMLPWQNSQMKSSIIKDERTGVSTEPIGVYGIPDKSDALLTNTSSSGLQQLDTRTGKIVTIPNPLESAPGKSAIKSVIIAPDKAIYASDDEHFFKYNQLQQQLLPYRLNDQNNKPILNVARNVTNANGDIYIGSLNNGFYIWNYNTQKLIHYNKWDIDEISDDKDNVLMPCLVDSKQNIWFTSNNGIYEYKSEDAKYYHFGVKEISGIPVMGAAKYIEEDKLGHYWIATITNGLYELYFENGKEYWNNYTVNSGIGLPADYCTKIKRDPTDSTLWIFNISGLLRFDPIQKKVLGIWTMQNGFAQEGGGYGFAILPDKKLVQLFYASLTIVDLNTYLFNKTAPKVEFNSIKVLDKERLYSFRDGEYVLHLNNEENFLQFEFSALVFNNSNRNQYAYMLEGADKDWMYSGQKNAVSYSGLKPGTYYFKVKAANNDGVWGAVKVVKIIIAQPFYFRWWFIALCIVALAFLILWWNRFKIRQAKKEENLKAVFQQQIAQTEMKALRAQMNPHFIFNSLNSIQKYILKNDHFSASQYLTKFSRLIRLILDHSNQSTILLSSELDLLKLYVEMESLRFDDKFDYTIAVATNVNAETIAIPSMLIQPYIENAIWHGLLHKETKGKLTLLFNRIKNDVLEVIIEDDGVGREKAAALKSKQVLKKKSFGMQITEDRIAIINRTMGIHATCEVMDLKNDNGDATGTRVVLHIPLQTLST